MYGSHSLCTVYKNDQPGAYIRVVHKRIQKGKVRCIPGIMRNLICIKYIPADIQFTLNKRKGIIREGKKCITVTFGLFITKHSLAYVSW